MFSIFLLAQFDERLFHGQTTCPGPVIEGRFHRFTRGLHKLRFTFLLCILNILWQEDDLLGNDFEKGKGLTNHIDCTYEYITHMKYPNNKTNANH